MVALRSSNFLLGFYRSVSARTWATRNPCRNHPLGTFRWGGRLRLFSLTYCLPLTIFDPSTSFNHHPSTTSPDLLRNLHGHTRQAGRFLTGQVNLPKLLECLLAWRAAVSQIHRVSQFPGTGKSCEIRLLVFKEPSHVWLTCHENPFSPKVAITTALYIQDIFSKSCCGLKVKILTVLLHVRILLNSKPVPDALALLSQRCLGGRHVLTWTEAQIPGFGINDTSRTCSKPVWERDGPGFDAGTAPALKRSVWATQLIFEAATPSLSAFVLVASASVLLKPGRLPLHGPPKHQLLEESHDPEKPDRCSFLREERERLPGGGWRAYEHPKCESKRPT